MTRKLVQAESLKELQEELLNATTKEQIKAIADKIRNIKNK